MAVMYSVWREGMGVAMKLWCQSLGTHVPRIKKGQELCRKG
jgi:hypothetical protein